MPLYATDPKYYDLAEVKRQVGLWSTNNKHPWYDAPATLKVIEELLELRRKKNA